MKTTTEATIIAIGLYFKSEPGEPLEIMPMLDEPVTLELGVEMPFGRTVARELALV